MMQFDLNVSPFLLSLNTVIQGIGVGLAWVPITIVTFATLKPEYRAEAMGMFHLLRKLWIEPVHICRGGRNRTRLQCQLCPHDRGYLAVQCSLEHAVGDRCLVDRYAPGYGQFHQRDRPPIGHDRLPQRPCYVHAGRGDRDPYLPIGAASQTDRLIAPHHASDWLARCCAMARSTAIAATCPSHVVLSTN